MLRKAGRVLPRGAAVLALTLAVALGGCRPDDQETGSLDPRGDQTRAAMDSVVLVALDSGTVAFKEHRFEDALAHYQSATEQAPDHPSGWFGVSISQEALGNVEAAESAMAKVRDLAPGATILHPDDTAGTGGSEP